MLNFFVLTLCAWLIKHTIRACARLPDTIKRHRANTYTYKEWYDLTHGEPTENDQPPPEPARPDLGGLEDARTVYLELLVALRREQKQIAEALRDPYTTDKQAAALHKRQLANLSKQAQTARTLAGIDKQINRTMTD